MSNRDEIGSTDRAWAILRTGAPASSGLEIATVPSVISTLDGPIRLALGANGEARILFPLSDSESGKEVIGAPALRVSISAFNYNRKQQRFLDLTCLSQELEKVFGELGDEILSRVESGIGCVEAARSTIEEFRTLLMRPNQSTIQLTQVAGLVGELLFLNRLLDRDATAWKGWRGPAGDRHDFSAGHHSIEVKASLSRGRTKVTINGFDQLEIPDSGSLHLLHLQLEATGSGRLSVDALGRSALSKANEPEKVRQLLSAMGCDEVSDPSWNHTEFRLEDEALYEVADGFPRLVPSMFATGGAAAGISNVSYNVDLSSAEVFRVDTEDARRIEGQFLQCL